ncbi:MAG: hypothetical protein AAFR45_00770 [Pseudomonadota bacterium]
MTGSEKKRDTGKAPASREDRLKAALKANLARRKSQARARTAAAEKNKEETED